MADPRNKPIAIVFQVASPAAGAGFTITPNTAADWLIRSLTFELVTDANVANRHVAIHVSNGSVDYRHLPSGAVQAASLTRVYSGSEGAAVSANIGNFVTLVFPERGVWLPNGHSLSVVIDSVQAGDQVQAIAGYRFEFPLGPRSHVWPFMSVLEEESS